MGNSPSAGQSGGALPPAAARPQQQYAAGGAAAGFAGPHPYAAGPYGPPAGVTYPPGPGGHPPPYPGAYGGPRPMFMTPEVMQAMLLSGASPHVFLQQGGFAMPPQPVAPPRVEHATTVRNDVNLKKGSLKFLRDRRCPERLYLEFSFDAGQPCAITVYFAHRSDEGVPPGTSLVQRLVPYRAPHCGRRTLFRKGLGQTYSQALLSPREEGGCEWLDLRAFNEEELTNAPGTGDGAPQSSAVALGGSAAAASPAAVPAERYAALPPHLFPVVITIETVPEGDPAHAAACAAGPTGTSVPVAGPAAAAAAPGSAASRVGLQVTYASILHRPAEEERDHSPAPPAGDGSAPASPISASHAWIVKPLRQRIQIAGTVYELREIYGIEGSSTAPGGGGSTSSASGSNGTATGGAAGGAAAAAEEVLASGSECVVCLTDKRDTTVLPCRHMCLCYECAQQLRYSTNKCPICRAPVTSLLQIKIGGSAPSSDAGGARAS